MDDTPPSDDVAEWHHLLAPLPADAPVERRSMATTSMPETAAITGWEQVTVVLSEPCVGLRHVLVVLDATGRAISASDGVTFRRELTGDDATGSVQWRHESIGGRIEPDGRFLGTAWVSSSIEAADGTTHDEDHHPSVPAPADVARLWRSSTTLSAGVRPKGRHSRLTACY